MENKEFLELLNKFYDNGLLKEVYRSPRAIVCNVFNQYYLAFSLDIIEKYRDAFPGFVINSMGLKTIIQDDDYLVHHYSALSEEMKDKSLAVVDERLFQHMLAHKSEFSQRPPKAAVDLSFEQKLLEQGVEGIRDLLPGAKPKKTKLFNFFSK